MNRLPFVLLQLIQEFGKTREQFIFKYCCNKKFASLVHITRIKSSKSDIISKLTNQDLQKHKRLRILSLLGKNDLITDEGLKDLPLTTLRIARWDKITDASIINLPLKVLQVVNCQFITDESITKLKFLRDFTVYFCNRITRKSIVGKKLSKLEFYTSIRDSFTDLGMKDMPLKKLKIRSYNNINGSNICGKNLTDFGFRYQCSNYG